MTPTSLTPLSIPVPAALEAAVGYFGAARWIALAWEPAGDEVMLCDGIVTSAGVGNWHAYREYTEYPAVAPALAGYNLGDSMHRAEHWLVIDRQERRAYIAAAREAERFLVSQACRPAPEEDAAPTGRPATMDEVRAFVDELAGQRRAEYQAVGAANFGEYIAAVMTKQAAAEAELARQLAETP